jgi:hypothetical protein
VRAKAHLRQFGARRGRISHRGYPAGSATGRSRPPWTCAATWSPRPGAVHATRCTGHSSLDGDVPLKVPPPSAKPSPVAGHGHVEGVTTTGQQRRRGQRRRPVTGPTPAIRRYQASTRMTARPSPCRSCRGRRCAPGVAGTARLASSRPQGTATTHSRANRPHQPKPPTPADANPGPDRSRRGQQCTVRSRSSLAEVMRAAGRFGVPEADVMASKAGWRKPSARGNHDDRELPVSLLFILGGVRPVRAPHAVQPVPVVVPSGTDYPVVGL